MTVILFENVSGDVNSSALEGDNGKKVILVRADDFGTATVTIEIRSRNDLSGRYAAFADGVTTANKQIVIDYLPVGTALRARISGSNGSTSNIWVEVF